MSDEKAPEWWAWKDIIAHAHLLGIPNFQRGAVWDASNRSALLESVYEKSPCGSFVLWQPGDDSKQQGHGVPLCAIAADISPPLLWLVDGQQRTRTMLSVFQDLLRAPNAKDWSLVRKEDVDSLREIGGSALKYPGEQSEEDANQMAFWAVVLPAMRVFERDGRAYFGSYSESRKILRGSMFRRLHPQARIRVDPSGNERNLPPGASGTIPLVALVAPVGVFNDNQLRVRALAALQTFDSQQPDLRHLDELMPWGPLFVTGHTYDRPAIDGADPSPIRWKDLHERRDENIRARVERLAGLFEHEWAHVFESFADMLIGNRFAVGWLPSSEVGAAIDAYVRINRAGIRVRVEERALALLSRAHSGLLDELAAFIRDRDEESVDDQRSLLAHEADRQLGFAVWMRIVTRYSALALLGTAGCRWLDTTAIDKVMFSYRLDRVGPEERDAGKKTWARSFSNSRELVQECAKKATHALLLVDSVLSEELFLDHRMARPSPRAITPLIDLLYRLPTEVIQGLSKDQPFRSALASLVRWTLLFPYIDQPDLEQLVLEIHGISDPPAGDAPLPVWESNDQYWKELLRDALRRYGRRLSVLWTHKRNGVLARSNRELLAIDGYTISSRLNELAIDAFRDNLHEARSLQHPAVGWLYALERRAGAAEFNWQAQYDGHETNNKTGIEKKPGSVLEAATLRRAAGKDEQALYPEKQHIVPFVSAGKIVEKGGTRATASPANAIGNLTWLSQRQNALDALADRWTVMDRENDAANLTARGMFAQRESQTAVDLYEKVRDGMLSDNDPVKLKPLFDLFCAARTDWMVSEMKSWIEEPLSNETQGWLSEMTRA